MANRSAIRRRRSRPGAAEGGAQTFSRSPLSPRDRAGGAASKNLANNPEGVGASSVQAKPWARFRRALARRLVVGGKAPDAERSAAPSFVFLA